MVLAADAHPDWAHISVRPAKTSYDQAWAGAIESGFLVGVREINVIFKYILGAGMSNSDVTKGLGELVTFVQVLNT